MPGVKNIEKIFHFIPRLPLYIEINSNDNTAVKKYMSTNPLIVKFNPQIYITRIEAVYFSTGIS